MPEVVAITDLAEFRKAIGEGCEDDNTFTIVDFWAPWCGPCRMISPTFEQLAASDASNKVKYLKVDVDEAREIASTAGITAMPTFIVFQKGKPVNQLKGANVGQLTTMVKQYQA